jgi:hypothetical protein
MAFPHPIISGASSEQLLVTLAHYKKDAKTNLLDTRQAFSFFATPGLDISGGN